MFKAMLTALANLTAGVIPKADSLNRHTDEFARKLHTVKCYF